MTKVSENPSVPIMTLRLIEFMVVGKSMAFTSIKFTDIHGELVARGSHTK